jgi:chromosome partitioning protein
MTGKVISIVNRKGGVGKTTLALGIADAFVSEHRSDVSLIDLDPQSTASHALLAEDNFLDRVTSDRNLFGLLAARIRGEDPDVCAHRQGMAHFIKARGDVDLRLYPNSDRFWDLEESEIRRDSGAQLSTAIERVLDAEVAEGRLVVVDCPPGQTLSAQAAIRRSDLVLCPVTPDRYGLWGMDILLEYVMRVCDHRRPLIKFIVTRVTNRKDARQARQKLYKEYHDILLLVVPGKQTPGESPEPASFSDQTAVHGRIQMHKWKTLPRIYGNKGAKELKIIVDAIRMELYPHG